MLFRTVVVIVSVHCIISAFNSCDFSAAAFGKLVLQCTNKTESAVNRRISSVGEAMDKNLLHSCRLCGIQKRKKMIDMAVNPSVRKKSHKMQRRRMLTTIFKRLANSGTASEPAAFRKVKNPCQILKNDSARTDICVPDF